MLETVVSLAAGAVFGLALAAPPGPMNAVIAEESVVRGWNAGFRAGLGAATADLVFFLLSAVGVVAFVERFPAVRGVMVGAGGLLMCYFAYGAVREVRGSFRPGDGFGGDGERAAGGTTGFRRAFVLALTNPYQVLFWLTIGVGLLEPGRLDLFAETVLGDLVGGSLVVRTGSPALVVGFFGGIGLWITAFPAALVTAERRVEAFAPVVAGASALVLAGFGVTFLLDAARTLGPLIGA